MMSMEFSEIQCLENCAQIVVGGTYNGTFDPSYSELRGHASLRASGLKGQFVLKRVMTPE